MSDPRLKRVSAKRWTNVVCDEVLFADLLMVYFVIDHPFWGFLDKDSFLDDLVAGRSRFCSPLLVNAMCSLACVSTAECAWHAVKPFTNAAFKHYAAQIEYRGQPWSHHYLGFHFLQEARRLWNIEEGKTSLTTIQAALLLCFNLNCDGKDKLGETFISHAVRLSQDLGFFASSPSVTGNGTVHGSDDQWKHVRAVTAWAVFNVVTYVGLHDFIQSIRTLKSQSIQSFALRLPPILQKTPAFPIPYSNPGEKKNEKPSSQIHDTSLDLPVQYFNAMQKGNCELFVILNEVSSNYLPGNVTSPSPPTNAVMGLSERLLAWHERLPSILAPDASIVPQHLFFQ